MSREKSSEGPYRTNGSMIDKNSKGGPEELDTRSVVQTVEQDDSLHGGDKTRRTLKVCKYQACLFNSFGLMQFFWKYRIVTFNSLVLEVNKGSSPSMTMELLKSLFIQP